MSVCSRLRRMERHAVIIAQIAVESLVERRLDHGARRQAHVKCPLPGGRPAHQEAGDRHTELVAAAIAIWPDSPPNYSARLLRPRLDRDGRFQLDYIALQRSGLRARDHQFNGTLASATFGHRANQCSHWQEKVREP